MTISTSAPETCLDCNERAIFETPHGLLCMDHTMERLDADDDLWMPQPLAAD